MLDVGSTRERPQWLRNLPDIGEIDNTTPVDRR
jgi:hypothetical protein